jgi:hypothetical protein
MVRKKKLNCHRGEKGGIKLTIDQITNKYGVHAAQISKWKKQGLELFVQGCKRKAQNSDPNTALVLFYYR